MVDNSSKKIFFLRSPWLSTQECRVFISNFWVDTKLPVLGGPWGRSIAKGEGKLTNNESSLKTVVKCKEQVILIVYVRGLDITPAAMGFD